MDKAGVNTVELIANDQAGNVAKIAKSFNVVVPVEIRVVPEIINLRGHAENWTALITIRFPENVSYAEIQLSSIRINGVIVPVKSSNEEFVKRFSHHHKNGEVAAILLKLDKDDLQAVLNKGTSKLLITGSTDSFDFEGTDLFDQLSLLFNIFLLELIRQYFLFQLSPWQ